MAAAITISGETKVPKADIRVLGVQIDTKLRWGPHVKKIQEKMVTQTRTLTKITASTWGASFTQARHVYSAVIRPAITYGSAVWHAPSGTKDAKKDIVEKMSILQNKCLEQCRNVASKLRKRGTPTVDTPGCRKDQWALSITAGIPNTLSPQRSPPWIEQSDEVTEQLNAHRVLQRQREKAIKKHFDSKWQAAWEAYQRAHDRNPTIAKIAPLSKKRIDLHAGLARAESLLAVQIRTEKIGFAQFLHRQRVPAAAPPACECGWDSQTAKHVIRHCSLRPHRQRMLEDAGSTDYKTIVTTRKGLKACTAWLMKLGLLLQFSLATEQLYQ